MSKATVRRLSLSEYRTAAAVPLSKDERETLQAVIPSLTVTPTRGLDDHFDLTPSSWIGAIELPTLALEIRPKVPLDRVFFLISYALNPRAWRSTRFSFATADTLVEAMMPPFVSAVSTALRRGLLQGYRIEEDALLTVRGRIRFAEQINRRYGRIPPVEVRFDEFTEDIDENRLIKCALGRLARLRLRSTRARESLRAFSTALERVREIEYDPRQLPAISYSRLNAHYQSAVELAKLVIQATSLELGHGRSQAAAFLIDMNKVVRELRRHRSTRSTRAPSGHIPARRQPDTTSGSTSGRRIRLRPDLSWWEGSKSVFVGDVKYKRVQVAEIEHPDIYQLLAYTIATDLPGGLLIYAADEATPAEHVVPLAGKRLRVATLDLRDDPEDILERVNGLAHEIRQLRRAALRSVPTFQPA